MIRKPSTRRRARGRRRLWWRVVALLVALFVAATLSVFVWPPLGAPRRADAILSLNGPGEAQRRAEALSLARRGYAPVLLFSLGRANATPCPRASQASEVKLVCFVPDPGRTVGEVRFAARYARAHHLHSLLVVAAQAQAVRALLLTDRCFGGAVHVVGVDLPLRSQPYQVIYGWGAMGRALIDRRC